MKVLPNFFPHLYNIYRDKLVKVEEVAFEERFKHYKDKELGTGSLGTIVYKGNFQRRPIAIKKVLKSLSDNLEIEIMLQIPQHPNILRYFAKEEDQSFFYIATELCEGNLRKFIIEKSFIGKMKTKDILQQTVEGLNYLHMKDIGKYYEF